jgi:hypothetical protein
MPAPAAMRVKNAGGLGKRICVIAPITAWLSACGISMVESMPTVNDANLFISANGQTTTFPSGVSAPAALTTGQAQQMASLAGGGTKNQDIFQYRNKMPASGTEYGGVHLRILPSNPNDIYTSRVLDAAAASLQSHGYRTQRCAAGTGAIQAP